MNKPEIVLIAAVDACLAIGYNNQLPWHLPDDLKFFKQQTQGGVVVMGRKTFESLGCRPLPNRLNIVLTRQAGQRDADVRYADDWSALLASLAEEGIKTLWVIGGGEIYRLALPDADRLVITHVDTQLAQADTWFPAWEAANWQLDRSEHHPADERHAFAFTWQHYVVSHR